MKKINKSTILFVLFCCFVLAGCLIFKLNEDLAFQAMIKREYVVNQAYTLVGILMANIGIQYFIVDIVKQINGDINKAHRNIGNIYIIFAVVTVVLNPVESPNPAWQKLIMTSNLSVYIMAFITGIYMLLSIVRYAVWLYFNKKSKVG